MDHRGKKLLAFFSAIGLCLSTVAIAAKDNSILREMTWLAPEGQLEALTTQPVTRIDNVQLNNQNIQKFMVGQTLFHAPSLLGGQAAKAGISCASCHTNGRTNPHFQFPGVSGAPGTADITHSFFSSFRGDGKFNPVAISDLAKPGKVSRNLNDRALETFIRGLIVEEFDGVEPDKFMLDALSYYIRSLAAPRDEGLTMTRSTIEIDVHFQRLEQAYFSAKYAMQQSDSSLANLLIGGSRHQIGLIHQRFQGAMHKMERQLLEKLAQDLRDIQNADTKGNADALESLSKWHVKFLAARDILREKTNQSLYNPKVLEKALLAPVH